VTQSRYHPRDSGVRQVKLITSRNQGDFGELEAKHKPGRIIGVRGCIACLSGLRWSTVV
jgi:hypothetical protein